MMKKFLKGQKGITLISLSITVIILILITGVLIYNARDSIYIKNYSYLKNDIQNLRDKVSNFYNEYGSIPAKTQVTRISSGIETVFNDIEKQNLGEFYVLDLQVLSGLTLHYGEDYEKVKDLDVVSDFYPDLYIINRITHNIFLAGGVKAKEGNEIKIYYTDYSKSNNELVDFRYVDGIKIPDGYYYIGKNNEDKIVISPDQKDVIDENSSTQYVWQTTNVAPNDVNLTEGQTQTEFEQSVSTNNGYYYNQNTNTVIYLPVKVESLLPGETSTPDLDIYIDDDKIVKIPEGFTVSNVDGETSVDKGLVIYYIPEEIERGKDFWTADTDGDGIPDVQENYDQYVWIPVDGIVGENGKTLQDAVNGETLLGRYVFNTDGSIDTTDGITPSTIGGQLVAGGNISYYTEDSKSNHTRKNAAATDIDAFIQSVRDNDGYYIARFEAGVENGTLDTSDMTSSTAAPSADWTGYDGENIKLVVKSGATPWTYVTQRMASTLCQNLYPTSNVASDLINSYAWDTAILFIQQNGIESNSKTYSRQSGISSTGKSSLTGESKLASTGSLDIQCNIYDLAANCFEWTTETASNSSYCCVVRGARYTGSDLFTSYRDGRTTSACTSYSFRSILYY